MAVPFLLEFAQRFLEEYPDPSQVTCVFPNRRATLYFRKHLGELIQRPVFTPRLCTIEDFIGSLSTLQIADNLELVHRLHKVHTGILSSDEPFDQFYFWGTMLLRDFDEIDKNEVNAELLFKDLRNIKELDTLFDFITEEQRDFLTNFWGAFRDPLTKHKEDFLVIWSRLFSIYEGFRENLHGSGLAYPGMQMREVVTRIKRGDQLIKVTNKTKPGLVFIGFNALSGCEQFLISHYVKEGVAAVHWDLDQYYLNNDRQEAGTYFRMYQKDAVLGKTFPSDVPSHFKKPKEIHLYGVAQLTGQAKLMAQLLDEQYSQGVRPEETLVVLPDEGLLLPVLHGVSGTVESLNVTMGFPLSSTPMYNLLETLIELQMEHRVDQFSHRQVLALFGHPYVIAADAGAVHKRRKLILERNWARIPGNWLREGPELFDLIFRPVSASGLIGYLKDVTEAAVSHPHMTVLDREYAMHFIKLLNRVGDLVKLADAEDQADQRKSLRSFLRLFRTLVRQNKIPFSGEPLKGLQIMGVLETRLLDFRNVFVLSLNEGAFPASSNSGSYIPHSLRRAYGLSTTEQQDRMYAYLFYRVLQRAEKIHLFYNSETDDLGQGEMSRFLQQLIHESGLTITRHVLHNPLNPRTIDPITIRKDQSTYNRLASYCTGAGFQKKLSPTALRDYLECRLRFYFKYIAGVKEARTIDEELDSRMLGNFLHKFMEIFYQQLTTRKKSNTIEAKDLDTFEGYFKGVIDKVLAEAFGLDPKEEVEYEGQRILVSEVVRSFARQIIQLDKHYAPFVLEAIEGGQYVHEIQLATSGRPTVVVGGKIDRIDRKNDVVRIIDYKTGKDDSNIRGSMAGLFDRGEAINKAAFQTILYALLYSKKHPGGGLRIVPGIMNRTSLFDPGYTFGFSLNRAQIDDIAPLLPEFEEKLIELLTDLFSDDVPFDQTENRENCRYCAYRYICYRG